METQPPIVDASLSPVTATLADPRPRLGIIHLLLWMLVTAVLLAIQRATRGQDDSRSFFLLYGATVALINGAAIGGALVWITQLLRGYALRPIAGAYYLLVVDALLMILISVVSCGLAIARRWTDVPVESHFAMFWVASILGMLGATTCAALCYRQIHWLIFFLFGAGRHFLVMVLNFANILAYGERQLIGLRNLIGVMNYVIHAVALATIVVLIICVVCDGRRTSRRDWLYWTSVTTWTLRTLAQLALQCYIWFFFRA